MYASDESSPVQAFPSQTSDLMRAQSCCEGFCDDQHIAGRNNPDVRSDLSKQEARKRPERALLGWALQASAEFFDSKTYVGSNRSRPKQLAHRCSVKLVSDWIQRLVERISWII